MVNYKPPGNNLDQIEENIPKPDRSPSLSNIFNLPKDIKEFTYAVSPKFPPNTPEVQEFITAMVAAHNKYRKKHFCPPVVHNKMLSSNAYEWTIVSYIYFFFYINDNNSYNIIILVSSC